MLKLSFTNSVHYCIDKCLKVRKLFSGHLLISLLGTETVMLLAHLSAQIRSKLDTKIQLFYTGMWSKISKFSILHNFICNTI